MADKIGCEALRELLVAIRKRYLLANKMEKARILDEVVALAKCHRKTAIRQLNQPVEGEPSSVRVDQRIYDDAVREALTTLWEASDRICGKRLKAILPSMIDSMESHGHLQLDPTIRERLLAISPATIDRLLAPVRSQAGKQKKRRRTKRVSKSIPVQTFADWVDSLPGHLEIDFVIHCGGKIAGTYVHSFVATDVCSGWTEAVPLLVREQSLVTEGLGLLRKQFPVPVLGINSDNDSAFINNTLVSYCDRENIDFTRARPYRKNDQAWIEQKNGAVIRRFVGYERFTGKQVLEAVKSALRSQRSNLDPVELLHQIRATQSALASLASSNNGNNKAEHENLDEFIKQLPEVWKLGEVRPTHRRQSASPRDWRTRKDPFETTWTEILSWLQSDPSASAKMLFQRLQKKYPSQYPDGQLRTLQRRIREWRGVMARKLIFSGSDQEGQAIPVVPNEQGDTEVKSDD